MMEGLKSGQIATLYSPKPYSVFDWQSLGGAGSLVFGKAFSKPPPPTSRLAPTSTRPALGNGLKPSICFSRQPSTS